jgi:phosphatidate cytidylyltransferase
MNPVFCIVAILFLAGGLGIFLVNRKLPPPGKRKNWLKYFVYLFIVIFVIGSLTIDKKLFTALAILINAVGILEMMLVRAKSERTLAADRFLLISMSVYSVFLFFFFLFVLLPSTLILYTYVIVLVFDGASQISGQLAGRKKLFPEISPGKTWEGLIGGLLIAITTSVCIRHSVDYSVIRSLIWGFLLCSAAFSGDILASIYKRKFETKDFSNLLPGQGGMFDRFDSFITAGALAGIAGITLLAVHLPDMDIAVYLLMTWLFFMVLLSGEFFHHVFKVRSEWVRMSSHFAAGMISLFFMNQFSSAWYVLAICIQSALFLGATGLLGFFESHHKVNRRTLGSPLFFAGILLAYFSSVWFSNRGMFVLPVLVLTISDPLAAFAGMNFGTYHWKNWITKAYSSKTLMGSIVFFCVSLAILFSFLPFYYECSVAERVLLSLTISLAATMTEAASSNGLDNLTVPVVMIILMTILL